jgi:hypothetical protein
MSDVVRKLTWKNEISLSEKVLNRDISSQGKLFD